MKLSRFTTLLLVEFTSEFIRLESILVTDMCSVAVVYQKILPAKMCFYLQNAC